MKKFDVIALGELLIDFTSSGISEQGNPLFEANPGGAPCNVLAMLNKMGHKTAFIGKVGVDIFGTRLKKTLEEISIDTTNLMMDQDVRTTLAFVQNDESGDRSFSFYRSPGADMMLRAEEVNEELIKDSKIFHFGTLSMTHDTVREATKKALDVAKAFETYRMLGSIGHKEALAEAAYCKEMGKGTACVRFQPCYAGFHLKSIDGFCRLKT